MPQHTRTPTTSKSVVRVLACSSEHVSVFLRLDSDLVVPLVYLQTCWSVIQGVAYLDMGDRPTAQKLIRHAVSLNPQDPNFHNSLGNQPRACGHRDRRPFSLHSKLIMPTLVPKEKRCGEMVLTRKPRRLGRRGEGLGRRD